MSLGGFNVIKLRLRGDGRKYNFELMCDIAMGEYMMFTAPVYTNGGPLWQEVSVRMKLSTCAIFDLVLLLPTASNL